MYVYLPLSRHFKRSLGRVYYWSCDSDYRGLKKRIKAIRREQGRSVDDSSESDPDPLLKGSGASAHRDDGEKVADEDHNADNESNIHKGRHGQQAVVDTRDGEIEHEELTEGPRKVRYRLFFPLHVLNAFSRQRRPRPLMQLPSRNSNRTPRVGSLSPLCRRRRPIHQHYPHAIRVHGMVCADVQLDDVTISPA